MNKTFLNFLDSQKIFRIPEVSEIETHFFYGRKDKQVYSRKDIFTGLANFFGVYLPAYTDANLNEVLPHKIIYKVKTVPKDIYDLAIKKTKNGKYQCLYENQISGKPAMIQIQADSEVEAKAKMIIYLKKHNLLKHEDSN